MHDIVSEPLPESYDLVISRHTTIHLKNGDVKKAVKNFINSGSKYLLTTTYPNITVIFLIKGTKIIKNFRKMLNYLKMILEDTDQLI